MITFDQYYNQIQNILDIFLIKDLYNIILNYLCLRNINSKIKEITGNIIHENINLDIFDFTKHQNFYFFSNIIVKELIYFEYNHIYIFISNNNSIYIYRLFEYYDKNYYKHDYKFIGKQNHVKNNQFNSEINLLEWINKKNNRIDGFWNITNMLQN